MARRRTETERRPRLPPRLGILFTGAAIGAAWGFVIWLLAHIGGDPSGRVLVLQVVSLAMIGGGIAAIFETVNARKRGERLYPKLPYRRWRNR